MRLKCQLLCNLTIALAMRHTPRSSFAVPSHAS